jgi:hypothetical protein
MTPAKTPEPAAIDPTRCSLCGCENDCQLCTSAPYKGHCWCVSVKFSDEILQRIPPEARNRACLCRNCATQA